MSDSKELVGCLKVLRFSPSEPGVRRWPAWLITTRYQVIVWNRTEARAASLIEQGCQPQILRVGAIADADVVMSKLVMVTNAG